MINVTWINKGSTVFGGDTSEEKYKEGGQAGL
jgi:hypothetical protein